MDYATGIGLSCLLVGIVTGFCAHRGLERRSYRQGYDRGYVDGADEERRRSQLTPEERLIAGIFRQERHDADWRAERARRARTAVQRYDLLPQAQADAEARRLLSDGGRW